MKKIAIMGGRASFHELAARQFFPNEELHIVECSSFLELCHVLKNKQAERAVMAIENRIAGSILPNYQLIENNGLHIIAESYLPLQLNLYALPGTQIQEVDLVISHPMALAQSQQFLASLKARVQEYKDTANAAKKLWEPGMEKTAAIAGPAVGEQYNLNCLAENIGDLPDNYTRFYLLAREALVPEGANKASLCLQVANQVGSLAKVLQLLADQGVNMSKIQSLPLPSSSGNYAFHLDIELPKGAKEPLLFERMKSACSQLSILGLYKKSSYQKTTSVYEHAQ